MPRHTSNEDSDPEGPQSREAFLANMREGVRTSIARLRDSISSAAYPTLTALICSSACAPIVAAALGSGAALAAALGAIGAIGGNALSEVIGDRLKRLRAENPNPSETEIEAALAETIAEVVRSDSVELAEVRSGVAEILRQTDAFEIVMRQAVAEGNQELLAALRPELESLAGSSEENKLLLVGMHDLLLGLCRDEAASLEVQESMRDEVQESLGLLVQMFQFVQHLALGMTVGEKPGPIRWEGSPYRGLQPFTARETPIFFGRTVTLAELVTKAKSSVPAGMMLVAGPSGVGKSSLLRAGLVPAIESGLLRADPDQGPWRVILVDKPGDDPVKSLADELAKHGGPDSGTTRRSLSAHPEEAAERIEERRTGRDGERPERIVLVVDQFEELFSLADPDRRERFLRILDAIAQNSKAFVVLGVRSDYVDRCMEEKPLERAVQDRLFRVGPMTKEQMRQAIVLPARIASIEVEEQVVETLLESLHGPEERPRSMDSALPLMSQTMWELWGKGRDDRRLTFMEYQEIGGVERAVKNAAEEAFNSLGDEEQGEAERFFRRLVGVKQDGRLVRLSLQRNGIAEAEELVLEAFLSKRLLVADEKSVEIAHDVLLEQWDRLRDWLEPDLASRILFTQLEEDSAEWEQGARDRSFLYQGKRLAAVESGGVPIWERDPERNLKPSDRARDFLEESRKREARRVRVRRTLTGTLAGITALALVLAGLSFNQNRDLTEQRNQALSEQLAADSAALLNTDGELAQLLAAAAWKLDESDEAFAALGNSIDDPSTGLISESDAIGTSGMAFSPDGAQLFSATWGGSFGQWDTGTWEYERLSEEPARDSYTVMEMSPDGSRIAVSVGDSVEIWDTETGEVELTLERSDYVTLRFSPDSSMLATVYSYETYVWDVGTGEDIAHFTYEENPSLEASFTADGTSLLLGDWESSVQQWDIGSSSATGSWVLDGGEAYIGGNINVLWADPEDPGRVIVCAYGGCYVGPLDEMSEPQLLVTSSGGAVSPDGSLLAIAETGRISVWNTETLELQTQIPTAGWLYNLAFQPGTSTLAAATYEGIQLWDLDLADPVLQLGAWTGDSAAPGPMRFSGDLSRATEVISYEESYVWNLPTRSGGHMELVGRYPQYAAYETVINAEGTIAASSYGLDRPGVIELWDPETGELRETLSSGGDALSTIEFSPDGRLLASAGGMNAGPDEQFDSEVVLWDVGTGEEVMRLPGHEDGAGALAFSRDGSMLATFDGLRALRIWDARTGELRGTHMQGSTGLYGQFRFSPDGTHLAATADNGLTIWNIETGERQVVSVRDIDDRVHEGSVEEFDFTPDGRFLAMTLSDELRDHLVVWDLARSVRVFNRTVESGLENIAVAAESWTVAYTDEGFVQIVDLGFLQDPYAAVCDRAKRGLTEEEWETYLPGIEYESFAICD